MNEKFKFNKFYLIGGVAVLLVIIFWSSITISIDSGHAGVLYKQFGGGVDQDEPPLGSGFHFVAPWNKVFIYETRQQEITATMEVLSSNLLKIKMDVTILFQPTYADLPKLEVNKGRRYADRVVKPIMRSVFRKVIAKYLPEEINTTKREQVEKEVTEGVSKLLAENFVELNNILVRNIKLPQKLEEAIERKLKQEQESLEYEFRLEKESKEAERKQIEAEGIQKFQKIVTNGITQDFLRWKGIEATKELSESPNTKIVIIGNSKDGLPIILGDSK